MVSNALFYTFSTIAQTLAGAIALLGAFVLYRLQSLRTQIDEDSERISSVYGSSGHDVATVDAVRSLHRQGKYREVLEFRSRAPIPGTVYQAEAEQMRLGLNLQRQKALLRTFVASLGLTIGLIAASVGALAATPGIIERSCGPTVVFSVGIAWFVGCIVSYAVLIQQALR